MTLALELDPVKVNMNYSLYTHTSLFHHKIKNVVTEKHKYLNIR